MTEPDPRRWRLLPVVLSATFLSAFDFSVVNVAAPSLRSDLGAGPVALELVIGGYAFVYASGMVTGGRLGDLFGYRRLFLLGMAGFTLASLVCGLARNPAELVGARLAQGLTAAAMVPQVLALVTAVFPARERPRAVSWFGVTLGLGSTAGQVLGGLLLDANVFGLSWRIIFLLNVPVGLIAMSLALRWLPRTRDELRPRLDPLGVLGVSGSLALALVPLALGRDEGWPVWTWICLLGVVPAMTLTLWWERRLGATGGAPLLDLTLFRDRTFSVGLLINITMMAAFGSLLFITSLLLQSGLGASPLQSGLTFAPMALVAAVTSLLGRSLAARFGYVVLISGAAVSTIGALVFALELHAGFTAAQTYLPMFLFGLGNGFVLPSLVAAVLSGVRPERAGTASGMLTTTQQFSSATGVAVLGAVFFGIAGTHGYVAAAGAVAWIDLGLLALLTALIAVLARVSPSLIVRSVAKPAPEQGKVRAG